MTLFKNSLGSKPFYYAIYYKVSLLNLTISDIFVITRLLQPNNLYKIIDACTAYSCTCDKVVFFPMTSHSSTNPQMFSCVFLWLSLIQVLHEFFFIHKITSSHKNENSVIKTMILFKEWNYTMEVNVTKTLLCFFKDPLNKVSSSVMQSAIQLLDR